MFLIFCELILTLVITLIKDLANSYHIVLNSALSAVLAEKTSICRKKQVKDRTHD